MSEQPALSIRDLNKSFGALIVAQSIDVDLMKGARVGLIGPNGAGKTTFVNLLTGFVKADSGTIHLEGMPIEKMAPETRVKHGLARTHQINALLRENTMRDNVAIAIAEREGYAWRMMRFGRQWRYCCNEAQALLEEMGIGDSGARIVRELSYGQQRLLEIAIALALKPSVLLLDEPAAGVPSHEAHRIHDALEQLPAEMAILIIEHDMEVIFRFAREIIVLLQGRVLTRGEPAKIAADPEVRAVYLGRTMV